jgi:TonB-linked SusC/RagA family outer membrane protein
MNKNNSVGELLFRSLKKTLLIMRIVIILLLVGFLQTKANDAYSQNTKLSISFSNTELAKVLDRIENQSEFYFLYNEKLIDATRKVSIEAKDEKIEEVLKNLFSGTDVKYSIIDRKIILAPTYLSELQQPDKKVSGKVTDSSGATLPGVSIVVQGTTTGCITDGNGNFSLSNIPGNATLQFSFVGMKMQEVKVAGRNTVNVKMEEENIGIDEVVAVGYGKQSKRLITGSIANVNLKSQEDLPVTNIVQAIRGRVAGVQFTDNGRPGQGGTLLIRGQRSITASNAPLIILDGVPFNGVLSDINPNDVEAMDILKDASAAAIYGSKAANGVVLVTTRTGKTEKPVIRINAFNSFNDWSHKMKLLSPERYIQKTLDYRAQSGLSADPSQIASYLQPSEAANYAKGISVNPWDVVSQNSMNSSFDLSISAKNKTTNYFLSGAVVTEKGLLLNDNAKKISLRANLETQATDWLLIGLSSQFSNRDLSGLEPNMGFAYLTSPFSTIYDPNGIPTQYSVKEDQLVTNPLYNSWLTKNEEIYQNLFANLYLAVDVPQIKGLKYRLNYAPNFRWGHNYNYMKQDPRLTNNITNASKYNEASTNWTLENIVTYDRQINENNSFDLTLMYGLDHEGFNSTTASGTTFPTDVVTWNNLGQAATYGAQSSAYAKDGVSSMARINYRYKSRYFLTLTGRRDGSSVFASKNKYTFFPSAALGWVLSEDLKKIKSLDLLKIRLSYGAVGNQAINPYQSLSLTGSNQYVFGDGGGTSTGIYSANMGNSNLKWETTYSTNIAVDYKLFNGRIDGTVELYNLNTKDLILSRALPLMTGYSSVLVNLGKTNNKGIELTLNTINIHKNNFDWSSSIVFSMNKNKIVHIYNSDINKDGIEDDDLGNKWFIGKPISVAYDYVFDGIYQANDVLPTGYKPGWIRVKDLNGDGKIDAAHDRTVIGDLQPKYRWSFNNNFRYKNISLSVFVNALQGWISSFNYTMGSTLYPERPANRLDVNWWTQENKSNKYSSLGFTNPLGMSTYISRDFIRLQDVSLSYDVPKHLLNKVKADNLRIFLSGRNLYTWTKWLGPDPESGEAYNPTSKSISIGLNLSF